MSSNDHEDPNLTMSERYSKGVQEDGRERAERLLDINDGAEHGGAVSTQDGGAHAHLPPVQRTLSCALILGLLLIVGVTVLSRHYISLILEKHQLSKDFKELQTSYENLSNGYCQSQRTESQTQDGAIRDKGWKRFRCSCYYKSTERRTWTASRRFCQSRGADLVIINSKEEHDFVRELNEAGASWIGLQAVKTYQWQQELEWKWVDGSTPTYLAWHVGADLTPVDGSTAYMDPQGSINHGNDGAKQWICETRMY
ncbi:CD209 antigen-like protein D [Chaetodon auriga]|uniref:CD209 antigen-like protein D n=1 Tax=Chaetodon auriga TaxID=39042 RepID=UPI004032B5FE